MEYMKDGNLYEYLEQSGKKFPEETGKEIVRQLLEAVDFMQEKGISHGDIRFENIMVKRLDNE